MCSTYSSCVSYIPIAFSIYVDGYTSVYVRCVIMFMCDVLHCCWCLICVFAVLLCVLFRLLVCCGVCVFMVLRVRVCLVCCYGWFVVFALILVLRGVRVCVYCIVCAVVLLCFVVCGLLLLCCLCDVLFRLVLFGFGCGCVVVCFGLLRVACCVCYDML